MNQELPATIRKRTESGNMVNVYIVCTKCKADLGFFQGRKGSSNVRTCPKCGTRNKVNF